MLNPLTHSFEPANFTVPGIIAKLLVEEEQLFPGTEDKLAIAIGTGQDSVYIFHVVIRLPSK